MICYVICEKKGNLKYRGDDLCLCYLYERSRKIFFFFLLPFCFLKLFLDYTAKNKIHYYEVKFASWPH